MRLQFYYSKGDELLYGSKLPHEAGIAVALRTTGFNASDDEVLSLAIVDFDGNVLFDKKLKPQDIDTWEPSEASGGLGPADVSEAPELFQFEDELIEIFKSCSCVVSLHDAFTSAMMESSWVSLPDYQGYDLSELFCSSHCDADYESAPIAAVSLQGIADYYELPQGAGTLVDEARIIAAGYLSNAREYEEALENIGEKDDETYRKAKEAQQLDVARQRENERIENLRVARINAVMWLCAAMLFGNVAAQMYVRNFEVVYVVAAALATAFFIARWIMCLVKMYQLRKR